jgi:predicted Zn-ribbon and HTH transcriptional regulator
MRIGALVSRFLSGQPVPQRAGPQEAPRDEFPDWEVVGESHYQENLWTIVGEPWAAARRVRVAKPAALVPEPDNPYDANAVAVHIQGLITGYLSREDAEEHRPRIVARQAQLGRHVELPAIIAGGGLRQDGPGQLGVFLRHDPAVFGEITPAKRPESQMRTGLSDAIATDEEDDSYDLSWIAALPAEPIRAIPALRKLLESERDVLDRHFMLCELEEALYASREAFTSALDDYDDCCRQHDSEMLAIRAACMTKWTKVPWLDTYRQMCVRLAKAKRFEDALRWAERGLAIYGSDAARSEAVTDLRSRADDYRAKAAQEPQRARRPSRAIEVVREDETLICARCGRTFRRPPSRGRRPSRCPECRSSVPPT